MKSCECNSLVRRLFSLAGLLALALLAGPALAQKVDRPDVKVGDRWTFEVLLGPNRVKSIGRAWVITSVTTTRIEGTDNGNPLVLTPELNNVESPLSKNSDQRLLSFPLEVGKKWSFTDDYFNRTWGLQGRNNVAVAVVGYEKVRVPAGEFDAFKLEANGHSVVGGATAELAWTYWYAPAARAVVKAEYRTSAAVGSGTTTELASYRLQP
jgi:hypothetical protein